MKTQRLIWPWECSRTEVLKTIIEPFKSIVDMDSKIAAISMGKLRPRQLSTLFTLYYNEPSLEKHRIPQDYLVDELLPFMQKLITSAPKTFRDYDSMLLTPATHGNIVLTRMQVATIIACSWFGLFEYNYITKGDIAIEEFPEMTLLYIFTSTNVYALQCILGYFMRTHTESKQATASFRDGIIIIKRAGHVGEYSTSNSKICDIFLGDGVVDDSPAKMQVVSAHEFIGGELFQGSLTQEEILLLARPECLAAVLFCSRLNDDETITIYGAEKMSARTGFGSDMHYDGEIIDDTPRGRVGNQSLLQTAVIFIDASPRTSGSSQYISDFARDVNKAVCGFMSTKFSNLECVASGHWSYGFVGNDMQLKFLQLVIAASISKRNLIYHAQSKDFETRLIPFIEWLQTSKLTVCDLYNIYKKLLKSCGSGPFGRLNNLELFDYFMEH